MSTSRIERQSAGPAVAWSLRGRASVVALVFLASLAATARPQAAFAVDCAQLDAAASQAGVRIAGASSGRRVVGKGRLQFYSAPDFSCRTPGVFILPGESLDAYVEHRGFVAVLYINPKTGKDASGWVESARLRPTGYGIAPAQ